MHATRAVYPMPVGLIQPALVTYVSPVRSSNGFSVYPKSMIVSAAHQLVSVMAANQQRLHTHTTWYGVGNMKLWIAMHGDVIGERDIHAAAGRACEDERQPCSQVSPQRRRCGSTGLHCPVLHALRWVVGIRDV